jgi:tRNA pseudouridine38-40 synthase
MRRYCFTVAYDGTDFAGWQVQPSQPTVQQTLQDALAALTQQSIVKVHGSGRTDAGVHARGQVCHADIDRELPLDAFTRGLNTKLPDSIRIMSAKIVPDDFHARKSAVGKEYRYFIYQGAIMPPHLRLYRTHVYSNLNVAAMKEALGLLQGKHDFVSFSANPDREVETTVRTIFEASLIEDGCELSISVHGDGFLYKMVRSVVGWLIRVGREEVRPEDTRSVIESRVRTASVPTAAPQGLFLWQVFYPSASFEDNT